MAIICNSLDPYVYLSGAANLRKRVKEVSIGPGDFISRVRTVISIEIKDALWKLKAEDYNVYTEGIGELIDRYKHIKQILIVSLSKELDNYPDLPVTQYDDGFDLFYYYEELTLILDLIEDVLGEHEVSVDYKKIKLQRIKLDYNLVDTPDYKGAFKILSDEGYLDCSVTEEHFRGLFELNPPEERILWRKSKKTLWMFLKELSSRSILIEKNFFSQYHNLFLYKRYDDNEVKPIEYEELNAITSLSSCKEDLIRNVVKVFMRDS